MDVAYKIMFLIGLLYPIVSILFNGIFGAIHSGGDAHLGHDAHAGHHGFSELHTGSGAHHLSDINTDLSSAHDSMRGLHQAHDASLGSQFLSWFTILLNPIVAVSFLTVFGGVGILGTHYFIWPTLAAFFVALVFGMAIAFVLYRFFALPLYRSENSSHTSRSELIGVSAEVISQVMEGGFGEIRYTVNHIRYNAPAKHIDGRMVKQGQKVAICQIEDNIFYITEIDGFVPTEVENILKEKEGRLHSN